MKKKDFKKMFYLLKGLLLAFIFTFALIMVCSVILTYSSLSESKIPLLNTITIVISIILGSIYMGKKTKEKGWIYGCLIGVSYYFIMILINTLFLKQFSISVFSVSKLILASIAGVIGGMIGINI